jgi:hypothetical protein
MTPPEGEVLTSEEVPLSRLRFGRTGGEASPLASPAPGEHRSSALDMEQYVPPFYCRQLRRELPRPGSVHHRSLDRGDAAVLEAAVVAWGGEVIATYEQVPLLPLHESEAGLARGDFAQTDEAGVVFVDPGLGIWGTGWSMSRMKRPGDAGCFWV